MITRAPETPPERLAAWAQALGGRLAGAAHVDRTQADAPVRGLADDSREVGPQNLFFALPGSEDDGRRFARQAVERGAVAVVTEAALPEDLPAIVVGNAKRALREAADLWYGRPQDALDLVGVTGTKGKTTTAWITAAALRHAGLPTAVLGTVAHDLGGGETLPATNTTPGPLQLRRLLARARDHGCGAAVMEVSSHALDQGRVDGFDFRAGVFTNLGRDHLDYHETLEAYFEAKSRLFKELASDATAVLNGDDEQWWRLSAGCRGRVLTYGTRPEADLRAHDIHLTVDSTRFCLTVGGEGELDVTTPLVGRHNVSNLLAAVGAAKGLGIDVVDAVRGARTLAGVPGRLERIDHAGDLHVFVDYAHTEEALREVLGFLNEVGAYALVCVVGCGGDRDKTKRPLMARAASELADRAVFTSDNPRTEDPLAILEDMRAGVPEPYAGRSVVIEDRREAIHTAVREAPAGACVVVAGKGHETYQIQGTEKRPFDDADVLREALALRFRARQAAEIPGSLRGT